ncbi:hypothetical protein LIER_11589 [Lithospermum erythrorhizon]|uniref:Histone H2A C-terminal domain-containing protein n=1 Tax=Lithospermum erythrorhizon TaxID=34254 RepID=A0AAV3PNL4_LITER
MSSSSESVVKGGDCKSKVGCVSKSNKAGLQFPVGRVKCLLKSGSFGACWKCCNRKQEDLIMPRHIQLALQNDEELSNLLGEVIIPEGGVLPQIHHTLLPKKTMETMNGTDFTYQEF